MAKAVAKKQTAGAVAVPDFMKNYVGEGQDDISRDDITMPRLKLGQALTPEVQEGLAGEGDLIHNITREAICPAGEKLRIIAIAYTKEYILWYDRDGPQGGGIAARAFREKQPDGTVRYKWDKPNTTFSDKLDGKLPVEYTTSEYIDQDGLGEWGSQVPGDADSAPAATAHHNYVLILPDHDNQMVAISLSKSSEGKAKEFNTLQKMGPVPTYARIYELGTFTDVSKKKGDKFANYQFGKWNVVEDEDQFNALRDLHLSLKEKGVNVDFSDEAGGSEARTVDAESTTEKF